MTLKELLNKVEATSGDRVPTAAALRNGDSPVVAEQICHDGSRLRAYQNGYVLYEIEKKSTVFRADYCGGYCYFSCTEEIPVSEAYFSETEWWLRFLMEGEDRLIHNQNIKIESYEISYECNIEEVQSWGQRANPVMEDYVYQEQLRQAFAMMTDRQRAVVKQYYQEGYEQWELAKSYGITQQAIAVTLSDVRKKFQKNKNKFE
jgi:RNA polymerase sigma factor (sigma-70 family)